MWLEPILQGQIRDPCEVFGIIGHDCQSMAYGDASDEQVDVPNRSACAAQKRLEAAELLRSELINE
jgi:hypothetical protein